MILRHLAEVVREIKPEAVKEKPVIIEEAKRFKEQIWNEKEFIRLLTLLKANGYNVTPLFRYIDKEDYERIVKLLEKASYHSNSQLEYMTIGIIIRLSK